MHHKPAFVCSAVEPGRPTWLHPKEPGFEGKVCVIMLREEADAEKVETVTHFVSMETAAHSVSLWK